MKHDCATDEEFLRDEIEQLAQVKRFHEWLQADASLRKRLYSDEGFSTEQEQWLRKIGITLAVDELSFFWKYPVATACYVTNAVNGLGDSPLESEVRAIAERFPLLPLWGRWQKHRCQCGNAVLKHPKTDSVHEKFNAWRDRRIKATKSELGFFGIMIDHPVFAFELNQGCSVGCWFCSFAADKLSGTLDYPQRRDEVLSIVRQCGEIFGKKMLRLSLPYYRTEPHDNPHYIEFLRDFEKETGAVLCTSTAACNDMEWIRKLLDYYQHRDDGRVYYWPRLSVLTPAMLRKIHAAFTPMELKDTELLIQVKDHHRAKVTGGRILKEQAGLREVEDFAARREYPEAVPQGSIACVSGFNINLLTRAIMVFSPCYAGNKWPYGFRVFGQATYTGADDFADVIQGLMERLMFLSPPEDKPVKFRDDIELRPTEEGFDLVTPSQAHHFKGRDKCGPLGEAINSGEYTPAELVRTLLQKHKANPILVRTILQQLFDEGLLDEVYTD